MLVHDLIIGLRCSLDKVDHHLLKLHIQLENSLDNDSWDHWDHCVIKKGYSIYIKLVSKHNAKLVNWSNRKTVIDKGINRSMMNMIAREMTKGFQGMNNKYKHRLITNNEIHIS